LKKKAITGKGDPWLNQDTCDITTKKNKNDISRVKKKREGGLGDFENGGLWLCV